MKLRYLSPAQAKTVRDWWQALQPRVEGETPRAGPFVMLDRADRARLRRCSEPELVILESAFQRLAFQLNKTEANKDLPRFAGDYSAYALLAGVLSHVQTDAGDDLSFASLLGRPLEGKDKAPMSQLRFQRLQTCNDEADFYRQSIRAVKLLNGRVDVVALADDLLAWIWEYRKGGTIPQPKDRLKFRWANDYYCAALKLAANEE